MTPRELLADGRLTDAIAEQESRLTTESSDAAAHLFLSELLILAGRLTEAETRIREIQSPSPEWPTARRKFVHLISAERWRSELQRRPVFLPDPPCPETVRRWKAVRALRADDADTATRWIDRADSVTTPLSGHLDGREFEGFRDADDRFANVLELLVGPRYVWCPYRRIRSVRLAPARHVLDIAFRSAVIRLHDGTDFDAMIPLIYPRSTTYDDDDFVLGRATDWPDIGGPVIGVGAKLFLVGDEEILLSECTQIELRSS